MSPKRPTKGLAKQADALFSKIIRHRDGGCQSGRPRHAGDLQCAHLWTRGYKSVRWSEDNAVALCKGCHVYYTHHPIEWDDWMQQRLGPEAYADLRMRAVHLQRPDYSVIIPRLEARLAQLLEGPSGLTVDPTGWS